MYYRRSLIAFCLSIPQWHSVVPDFMVPDPRSDRDAEVIAATALVHGMTVVTRNIKDFAPTGVELLNPWEYTRST